VRQSGRAAGKATVVHGRGQFRGSIVAVLLLGGAAALDFLFERQNSSAFIGGIGVGFGCWIIWSIGISSKVVINGDGIRVDNFFVSHIISWKDFDSFVLDSGIWLTKRDGSRVFLVGFGGSLFGALTGYRSMRQSLAILQAAGARHRNAAGSFVTRDTVRLGLPVLGGLILVLEAAVFVGRTFH
jgi:hypothetical protein